MPDHPPSSALTKDWSCPDDRPSGWVPLFPASDVRVGVQQRLLHRLTEAERRVMNGPVTPRIDQMRFRAQLESFDFSSPQSIEQVCHWVVDALQDGLVHINHPRYFGLFNPTPSFPAQIADWITASFNPQLATHTTSPVAVEIETHLIAAFTSRFGFAAKSRGHFTTGGAEANYTALVLALHRGCPGFGQDGARGFAGHPVFYVSRDCHLAWVKIAIQAGIGRNGVRFVETDGRGRMRPQALQRALNEDRSRGCAPVMIVATAGTTNAGMIDPISACAEIADREKLWLHVDAAWGGGLIVTEHHAAHLRGIEQADSVTIDAHKWLATTMGCGVFITQHPEMLSAFQVAADFMPSAGETLDPYLSSVQWSRRFLGLRLFLALAVAGWDGYAAHIQHSLDLAVLLRRRMIEAGWQVVNESPVGVVCLLPPGSPGAVSDPRDIVRRVLASGEAWVSVATFEGQDIIRACVTSGVSTEADIDILVHRLVSSHREYC